MSGRVDGRMDGGVRRLRRGALHIAIDPQGGPIKDGVTFMAPTDSAGLPLSSRPQTAVTTSAVLVEREKKRLLSMPPLPPPPPFLLLLSNRHFLYRSAGQGLRALVSCSG